MIKKIHIAINSKSCLKWEGKSKKQNVKYPFNTLIHCYGNIIPSQLFDSVYNS